MLNQSSGRGQFKAPAAKTIAVDAAIANAQVCVEVFGGYGVPRENQAISSTTPGLAICAIQA